MSVENKVTKKPEKSYELLFCDLTSNIIGIGAPVLAIRYTYLSLESTVLAFSNGQETLGLSSALIASFNIASAGAFLVSGIFARRRASQIINGG